jgi:hypothetical protein
MRAIKYGMTGGQPIETRDSAVAAIICYQSNELASSFYSTQAMVIIPIMVIVTIAVVKLDAPLPEGTASWFEAVE